MTSFSRTYDIIVIGAGHAGCEAALAGARMGCAVLLVVIDLDKVAAMPCSPSIGGMAKGQLVKEIDALGGQMARVTDQTAIQYRTLNTKKGPAVHSTRTQNDKARYHAAMKSVLEQTPRLDLKQAMIECLVVEDGQVVRGDRIIPASGMAAGRLFWPPAPSSADGSTSATAPSRPAGPVNLPAMPCPQTCVTWALPWGA